MKTLLLLRHAKSSWENPSERDFARPLNARGLQDAPLMGSYLQAQDYQPDIILSSPATRARQTALLVREAAAFSAPVRYEATIYEAQLKDLLNLISALDEAYKLALIVGHNPGLTILLEHLTGCCEHLPTAAVAHIQLNQAHWRDIQAGGGQLLALVKPKQLSV